MIGVSSIFKLTHIATAKDLYLSVVVTTEGLVYYESLKRELKTKTIYGFRCDERLDTKVEESTRLGWTLLCEELEHLKIETKLINTTPVSVADFRLEFREEGRALKSEDSSTGMLRRLNS